MLYGDGIHDDTIALQTLLDQKGIIRLDRPGTYLVSKTLIIHSNTHFSLCPGAVILAAPGSRCALIENKYFTGGGKDIHISIVGGIWDGNCDQMGLDPVYEAQHREDDPYDPKLFKGKLIRFAHVSHISLEKMTVKDPVSYGIQIADAVGFLVRDIFFDYNWHFGTTDGVHINGPAMDGVIENLYGTTNDDMVSLTTIDESHAEVTMGQINNVFIHNISAHNGYSGVRLLSAGNYDMRCIHISGVYGDYRHNAVLVSHHYTRPNTRIWFDDIIIENVRASKSSTPLAEDCFRFWEGNNHLNPIIWFEEGICIGNAIIRDVSRFERSIGDQSYLIQLDQGANIQRLILENITQTNAPGVTSPFIFNKATIETLIQRDIDV